jgi:hypothetical protein
MLEKNLVIFLNKENNGLSSLFPLGHEINGPSGSTDGRQANVFMGFSYDDFPKSDMTSITTSR